MKLKTFADFLLEKQTVDTDKNKKFQYVMKEFADGKLHSNDGSIVTDQKQALAIAYSASGINNEK